MCLLSNDVYEYPFQSQGKTDIPGVDDGQESQDTYVSGVSLKPQSRLLSQPMSIF